MIANVTLSQWREGINTPEFAEAGKLETVDTMSYPFTSNSQEPPKYTHPYLSEKWGIKNVVIQSGIVGFELNHKL